MNPVDILRLLALAAIWGASFLFMRIIAPVIGTVPTAFFRVSIACLGLIAILAVVAAGYMMFTGRLNWPLFLAIFFGVVLVFSAATIIDGFAAP